MLPLMFQGKGNAKEKNHSITRSSGATHQQDGAKVEEASAELETTTKRLQAGFRIN